MNKMTFTFLKTDANFVIFDWLLEKTIIAIDSFRSCAKNAMDSIRWMQWRGPRSSATLIDRKTCEVCVQLSTRKVKFRFRIPRGPRTGPSGRTFGTGMESQKYVDFYDQDGTQFVQVLSKNEVLNLPSTLDHRRRANSEHDILQPTLRKMLQNIMNLGLEEDLIIIYSI